MAQRGHAILKTKKDDGSFKWVMYYIAYNAAPSYVLPILEKYPEDCAKQIPSCSTGIASFWDDANQYGFVGEYHDYKNYDSYKHPNTDYDTLEAALLECRYPDIYIWDCEKWVHQTISVEAKSKAYPLRTKRNVWRETRLRAENSNQNPK